MRNVFALVIIASGLLAGCSGNATSSDDDVARSEQEWRDRECRTGPEPAQDALTTVQYRDSTDPGGRPLRLRIGERRPAGPIKADILFLHGFADRMDNHGPLFAEWARRGYRVLSFDYPSHGESCGRSIDSFSFDGLAYLAAIVDRTLTPPAERSRPLFVAGWSTGGLVAARIAQNDAYRPILERRPSGMLLLTPGIAPRINFHRATADVMEHELTSNPAPPHVAPPQPKSPLEAPGLMIELLREASAARSAPYPRGLPTLVVTGGDESDTFVDSARIRDWVLDRRAGGAVELVGLDCPGAYHEVDNEPEPVGGTVRVASGDFFDAVLEGASRELSPGSGCRTY